MFAVGYVHRPHGLSGEVSVEKLGDTADPFEPGRSLVWISGPKRRDLKLSGSRVHGARWLLSFEGISDVEAARELSGGVLGLAGESLPQAPEDFFWSHEVEGWSCLDTSGRRLGTVRRLEETPAGPQLTLETAERREILVPFVRPIVVEIERASRRIVLDPPDGLMEL
jgi:16S rRNA processing protein RimM